MRIEIGMESLKFDPFLCHFTLKTNDEMQSDGQ